MTQTTNPTTDKSPRDDAKRTAQFFLDEPMTHWSSVGELKPQAQHEVIRHLDAVIERAVRLRGYLDERYGYGCGDQGHKAAVKTSNKLAKRIRKALGFTYPGQDINF